MGHMNVVANMPPIAERKGCKDHPDGYDGDCFTCFVVNGGGTD